MTRLFVALSILLAFTGSALAASAQVPELDPAGGSAGITLLLGGLAVVLGGGRRRSNP